jgi:hypothetical protein
MDAITSIHNAGARWQESVDVLGALVQHQVPDPVSQALMYAWLSSGWWGRQRVFVQHTHPQANEAADNLQLVLEGTTGREPAHNHRCRNLTHTSAHATLGACPGSSRFATITQGVARQASFFLFNRARCKITIPEHLCLVSDISMIGNVSRVHWS